MDYAAIIKKTIRLARKGQGKVSPNPMVGAVVVKNGIVLASGYHKKFGGPHAEVEAIRKCSPEDLKGAALFVNLEPCCHSGKTPPCTDLIIHSGISRVIIGMSDPNPLMRGKGIELLRQSGINVITGICEKECKVLNEHFICYITQKRPYITLKIAQTLDGFIARKDKNSKWISSADSRKRVHRLRMEHDAVLVGAGTVRHDDCMLTVRSVKGRSPARIIFDPELQIALDSNIVQSSSSVKTIAACTRGCSHNKKEVLLSKGLSCWEFETDHNGRFNLDHFLRKAAQEQIASILVEGGQTVFRSFIENNFFDRAVIFIAPKLFGQGYAAFGSFEPLFDKNNIFSDIHWQRFDNDMMFDGRRACLQES